MNHSACSQDIGRVKEMFIFSLLSCRPALAKIRHQKRASMAAWALVLCAVSSRTTQLYEGKIIFHFSTGQPEDG